MFNSIKNLFGKIFKSNTNKDELINNDFSLEKLKERMISADISTVVLPLPLMPTNKIRSSVGNFFVTQRSTNIFLRFSLRINSFIKNRRNRILYYCYNFWYNYSYYMFVEFLWCFYIDGITQNNILSCNKSPMGKGRIRFHQWTS